MVKSSTGGSTSASAGASSSGSGSSVKNEHRFKAACDAARTGAVLSQLSMPKTFFGGTFPGAPTSPFSGAIQRRRINFALREDLSLASRVDGTQRYESVNEIWSALSSFHAFTAAESSFDTARLQSDWHREVEKPEKNYRNEISWLFRAGRTEPEKEIARTNFQAKENLEFVD